MRDKLLIALLSVCCTLLVVNLVQLWTVAPSEVHGQGAVSSESGGYILATTIESSKPICFVFRTGSQHLAAYGVSGGGIRFMGVRKCEWDLSIDDAKGRLSVKDARRAARGKK